MSTPRVKEIINSIVKAMGTMNDISAIEQKLFSKFSGAGYRTTEIREAFDILLDLLDQREEGRSGRRDRRPLRLLTPREELKLTPPARRLLMGLYYGCEIDFDEMEEVLNCVTVQERVFNEEDIRLMLVVFFNKIIPPSRASAETASLN
jgi:uncharacterized protein Smg (DUF494 family)